VRALASSHTRTHRQRRYLGLCEHGAVVGVEVVEIHLLCRVEVVGRRRDLPQSLDVVASKRHLLLRTSHTCTTSIIKLTCVSVLICAALLSTRVLANPSAPMLRGARQRNTLSRCRAYTGDAIMAVTPMPSSACDVASQQMARTTNAHSPECSTTPPGTCTARTYAQCQPSHTHARARIIIITHTPSTNMVMPMIATTPSTSALMPPTITSRRWLQHHASLSKQKHNRAQQRPNALYAHTLAVTRVTRQRRALVARVAQRARVLFALNIGILDILVLRAHDQFSASNTTTLEPSLESRAASW
jgi:hypothetical protein